MRGNHENFQIFLLATLIVVLNTPAIAQEAKEDSAVYGWENQMITGLNLIWQEAKLSICCNLDISFES